MRALTKSITSCEEFVSKTLYELFENNGFINVIAWYPPDAKSYFTRKIQFTYLEEDRRRRYVPDMICTIGNWVLLIECKCNLTESLITINGEDRKSSDKDKLIEIIFRFGPNGISKTILLQNPKYEKFELDIAIPCLAVKHIDAELPKGFLIFKVQDQSIARALNKIGLTNEK